MFLNLYFRRLLLLVAIVLGSLSLTFAEDAPGCEECQIFEPGSDAEAACVEANNCSDGTDVPVNGNLWVLALAGFVFAFVKFGGHTKVAGYYYSKEKQE